MSTMRRTALIVLLFLLAAMASPVLADSNPSDVAADFNNDGFADLAIGVPAENGIGAVNVLYGNGGGLSGAGGQLFIHEGDVDLSTGSFGAAVAAGDFNHDGFADLAAGAPTAQIGRALEAGTISVIKGTAAGLSEFGGPLYTQFAGATEGGDQFGFALAAGDFNNDGFDDLAVGAPFEDAASIRDAGAVSVLYGSGAGLTSVGGRLFTQVAGAVEEGDHFGSQLAAGDFNNNGSADLAAAAPSESVGSAWGAGAVSVLYGTGAGLTTSGGQLFTQNSPGVPGAAEAFDHFGGIDIIAG
jgi:FG-GAP repeat